MMLINFKTSFLSVFLKYEFKIVSLTKYLKMNFDAKKIASAIDVSKI